MRLRWADKIPLALFVLMTLFLMFIGPQNSGTAEYWSEFGEAALMLFMKIILPIWIATRFLDLIVRS
jgi:hypothetical protein